MNPAHLDPLESGGGSVDPLGPQSWRLRIPAGPDRIYRLAQLDDYRDLGREWLLWRPPATFSLKARVSQQELLGTWGFGFWNDPFNVGFPIGGATRRLPALPNTAWYFFASAPNYLSFRDDLPTRGLLAATFSSPQVASPLLAMGIPAVPLLFWRPLARRLRTLARRWIHQSALRVDHDLTVWHHYSIVWDCDRTVFQVDGKTIQETEVTPLGPLGLVLWIDNQYAAFTPKGSLVFGTLPNPHPGWIEIDEVEIK